MPLGTVLLRWLGQYGVGVLGLVPFVGCLSFVYSLLDYLWPLWDDKNRPSTTRSRRPTWCGSR